MGFISNASNSPTVGLSGNGILKNACYDADGDGLCDDWERYGVYVRVGDVDNFIDLPGMAADPNHKDVFVQADWMSTYDHHHQPDPDAMLDVVAAFADAPSAMVRNPDGRKGISLHVDCGPDCEMTPGIKWGTAFGNPGEGRAFQD